jgi:ParB-like chromosome segregation protein Spo0J
LADERPAAPNPRNARTHTDEQIDQLVASIREFGWTNPILADPSDNDVIAGHGRLL